MSYILDALKKADSERDRGTIPSIHARQVPYMAVSVQPSHHIKLVLWLIAGLLMVILGALAWRMSASMGEAPVQVAAPVIRLVTPPISTVAAPAAPTVSQPVAPPPVVAQTLAKDKPDLPAHAPSKTNPKVALKSDKPVAVANAPGPLDALGGTGASGVESRIYALNELPDNIQRDLPKLAISGGTYSSNPAQRLLIVNNQVFSENGQPAPGVTVEQIRPNAAVLSFRGYRYRVAY
jgi:general secretion pathway protein B